MEETSLHLIIISKGDFTMRLRQRSMAGMKEPFIKFLSGTQSVSWQNNRP
jgi:hypothetical protein